MALKTENKDLEFVMKSLLAGGKLFYFLVHQNSLKFGSQSGNKAQKMIELNDRDFKEIQHDTCNGYLATGINKINNMDAVGSCSQFLCIIETLRLLRVKSTHRRRIWGGG